MVEDEFLAHHGIPGMRWGIRNALKRSSKGARSGSNGKNRRGPFSNANKRDLVKAGAGALVAFLGIGMAKSGIKRVLKSSARKSGAQWIERQMVGDIFMKIPRVDPSKYTYSSELWRH